MFFYHETSLGCFLNNIKENGLLPKKEVGKGNWRCSNNEVVYLSCHLNHGLHHVRSCLINDERKAVTIKIDSEKITEENLRVDENWLCGFEGLDVDKVASVSSDKRWKESMEKDGLLSHLGKIKPSAFASVDYVDVQESKWFMPELFEISSVAARLQYNEWVIEGYNMYAIHKRESTFYSFPTKTFKYWFEKGVDLRKAEGEGKK